MRGGIGGILAGIAATAAIAALAHWPIMLSAGPIIGSFACAAATGVFFGYYPARRAASLDPIDALRFE
jgi:ABC-type antimicrobial peptide transport system permease subunit